MVRILIVEDDEILNGGIRYCLSEEGYAVDGVYNIAKAKEVINEQVFDLAIVDINLPDGSGFELCPKIKEIFPEIPIVFLTARDLEKDVIRGFDLGADDYITKPFNINIFKKKIKVMLNRYHKIKDIHYTFKNLLVDFETREIYKDGLMLNITPTEYKIVTLFIEMRNHVITKDVFIDYLYQSDGDYVDEHALAVYISRLRAKIEDRQTQFIKTVYGMGYMWIEE